MKPSLLQLAEEYPDLCINIKLSELLEAFRQVAEEIHETYEDERAAKQNDVLISREEAMKELGVCDTTLWRWGREGYLKPVRLGAKVKYHKRDIDQLKENG